MALFNLNYVLDAERRPVPVDTSTPEGRAAWANFFDCGSRTVGFTQINSEAWVSTVFLGIDHQFGKGPPLLFETMIFGGKYDQAQWRYSSWDDAEVGHRAAVRRACKVAGQKVRM